MRNGDDGTFNRSAPRLCRAVLAIAGGSLMLSGCPAPPDGTDGTSVVFNNMTDPTNAGADFLGSAACMACHPNIAARTRLHGHRQALTRVQGGPPQFPSEAPRAGVPNPPDGKTWNDVSYVIGGYLHNAQFVDQGGFVMTDGVEGVNTQWNLDFGPNATIAGFAEFQPDRQTPLPYEYECFRCHTVGPQRQDPVDPRSQDGRPGILGTWTEPGVQCEACHGPGSNHVPNPAARDIFVNSTVRTCAPCHTQGDDPDVIVVENGFINPNTQIAELRASGGHSGFSCTVCHDPHYSTAYDRENGIRNECVVCHAGVGMPFHEGRVFRLRGYEEPVTCQSCHMPFAARSGSVARVDVVGATARIGDVRSHIFRINPANADFSAMFTADGTAVRKDGEGRAAVTVDFVCLRCHNAGGNVLNLTVSGAAFIAAGFHERAE